MVGELILALGIAGLPFYVAWSEADLALLRWRMLAVREYCDRIHARLDVTECPR